VYGRSWLSNTGGLEGPQELFRWSEDEGIVSLGTPPGITPRHVRSITPSLSDISADGTVFEARALLTSGEYQNFVWREGIGMRTFDSILRDELGLADAIEGWQFARLSISSISDDGLVMVGHGINPSGQFEAWYADLRPNVSDLVGDYNGNGTVEQSDLDLVLLNWGAGTAAVPDAWANDLPTGPIDQTELDRVLLNWGNTSASLGDASASPAVPEPRSVVLLLVSFSAYLALRSRSGGRRPTEPLSRCRAPALRGAARQGSLQVPRSTL
jgi:hypothetical protein